MDIRKFFTKPGGGPAKPAGEDSGKPKAEGKAPAAVTPKPAAAAAAAKPAAPKPSPAAKQQPPPAAAAPKQEAGGSAQPAAKHNKASPKKKQQQEEKVAAKPKRKQAVIESDSEDEVMVVNEEDNPADSDFEIDLSAMSEDEEDGKGGARDGSWVEEEEEVAGSQPAAKKQKGAGGKAAPAAKKPPASAQKEKKASGAAAKKTPPSAQQGKNAGAAAKKTPAAAASAGAKRKAGGASKTPKGPLAALSEEALAAVAAVDEAAQKLPAEGELGLTFMAEGSYNQRPSDEPPHWREKEAPRGHPDCLTGKTFVISGVLDSLKREEAGDFIKRHGGKVTGSVSGRTSFLVVGQFCGRSKYEQARQHNVRLINEAGLFSLVEASPDPAAQNEHEAAAAAAREAERAAATARGPEQVAGAGVKQEASGGAVGARGFYGAAPSSAQAALNSLGRAPASAAAGAGAGPGPGSSSAAAAAGSAAARGAAPAGAPAGGTELWVEKWRPKTAVELVGNNTTVATLRQWLRDWERVHLHGGAPAGPPGQSKSQKLAADLGKKAVLLSGPPGIGKTTSALIICRELGFEPVEVNASDTRGKADSAVVKGVGGKLANTVKEMSTNMAISYDAQGRRKKLCLIMDEVDGMSAGDRGGVADLIQTIHKSKVPIICICNDKYSQKLKSLRNHTLELDFRKPTKQQVAKRMLEICQKEGLSINQATMEALAETANGDIRLVLGQLQMIRLRARALSYDQVKGGGFGTAKDMEMSPFEAARKLLSFDADGMRLADQIDLVFQDMDLVPLLIQENYVNHRPRLANNDVKRMQILAKAADSLSGGDIVTRRVRQYQSWSLMPFAVALGSVTPAAWMRGGRETFGLYPNEPNFPRFTAWLGNNSTSNKQKRLLGELHTRMLSSTHIECDRTGLRLAYLPVLRNILVRPLLKDGKEGIPVVLRSMRDYCLARDDIDFITDVTKFKTKAPWGEDPMKGVETQVKSAFTRAFNQQHIKPKTGFGMDDKVSKKRGGKGKKAAAEEDEEDEEMLGEVSEGGSPVKKEEEEEELDPVMVRQKAMALKSKGMTLTLKDGTAAATGRGGKSGGRGRGGGASGSGRGRGAGSGRGGAASGRGSGRGRGKK